MTKTNEMEAKRLVIRVSIVLVLLFCSALIAQDKPGERDETILRLEKEIIELHDKLAVSIPASVRLEILDSDSEKMLNLGEESDKWLHEQFSQVSDAEIVELMGSLSELEHGDDWFQLLSETFWCRLNEVPLNLEEKIKLIGIYWKEHGDPVVSRAPEGGGEIHWYWKLDVKSRRPYGVLHVGIDTETRRFLCYENTIGLYYPEGETLEYIRAKIVQDPEMALQWVGKEYLKKNKLEKK